MPSDERVRRNAILGIDLLEQAAAEVRESEFASEAAGSWDAVRDVREPRSKAQHVGVRGVGGRKKAVVVDEAADGPSPTLDNRTPSPYFGALQAVVDELFDDRPDEYSVRRLDVVIAAESSDLPDDLLELVNLLPPGEYSRKRLCTQLNSAIGGHAWGQVYGTVS